MSARLACLPLRFDANHGQLDERVSFLARGSGYRLFLTPDGATLALHRNDNEVGQSSVVKMTVVGGHAVQPSPVDRLPGLSNYFVGNDRSKWRTGVEGYARVRYRQVLPGVDVVYYGTGQSRLEYDVVLAPGSDPKSVALAFEGAQSVEIEPDGAALLRLHGGGEIVQPKPVAYQLDGAGRREPVDVRYELREGTLAFAVGRFDARRSLVIDPALVYSTYLGGTASEGIYGLAIDGAGNAFIAGTTSSTNFPMFPITGSPLPFQSANRGGHDAFVAKLNAAGSALVYSTYLGGSGDDFTNGLAIDAAGEAFVTGHTSSGDFPTLSPLQPNNKGGTDAFVTKLNASGSALLYSTYVGGSGTDQAKGIAVDAAGAAFIAGFTSSHDFPTVSALQGTNYTSPGTTAFVAKINAAGSMFTYSTYLGGSGGENANGIAIDAAGDAFIVGFTSSSTVSGIPFPTTPSAPQISYGGGPHDAFVAEVNPTGLALVYSSYLGGSGDDEGTGIAVDSAGEAFVTGYTTSVDFRTVSPLQPALKAPTAQNAFVAKLGFGGSALVYSTYLGGSGVDQANGIAIDAAGEAVLAGTTTSTDFPAVSAFQSSNASAPGKSDAFITKLSALGSALVYSTYLGGADNDLGNCIAVDPAGDAFVAGETASTDLPMVSAFQGANEGKDDAFLVKLAAPSLVALAPAPAPALGTQTVLLLAAFLVLSGLLVLAKDRRTITA